MTLLDRILFIIIVLFAFGMYIVTSRTAVSKLPVKMTISREGEVLVDKMLPCQGLFSISTNLGRVLIEADGYRARFKESPCGNKLCVKQGYIESAVYPVVCLPTGVILSLERREEKVDALAK